jgi:UPF0716 protein FxsA
VYLIIVLLFIVLPIAELYVIIQVGDAIGVWPTIALLLLDGFLGAALLRSQGRTAWRRFQEALARNKVPAKEVYDGAAIIFGGALLMTPGFITDIFGFILLIPPLRAAVRKLLVGAARRFGPMRSVFFVYDRVPRGGPAASSSRGPRGNEGRRPPPTGNGASRPSRSYDFEGSAREIPDDSPELDPGERG